jgi:hypothetical protein
MIIFIRSATEYADKMADKPCHYLAEGSIFDNFLTQQIITHGALAGKKHTQPLTLPVRSTGPAPAVHW